MTNGLPPRLRRKEWRCRQTLGRYLCSRGCSAAAGRPGSSRCGGCGRPHAAGSCRGVVSAGGLACPACLERSCHPKRHARVAAPDFLVLPIAPVNRAAACDHQPHARAPVFCPEIPDGNLYAARLGSPHRLPEGANRMSLPLAESMNGAAALAVAGKAEEALAVLCGARDEGHRSAQLASAIGHLQFELRQFEAAAGTYAEALRQDRGDSTNHYNRGVCLEKLASWEEAAAEFQKAIELDSRRAGSYLGLGIAQLHLERPQDALATFEKCLERQPFSRCRAARPRGGPASAGPLSPKAATAATASCCRAIRGPKNCSANTIALAIDSDDYDLLAECSASLLAVNPQSRVALEAAALGALRPARFRRRPTASRLPWWEAHPASFAGLVQLRRGALYKLGFLEKAAAAYSRAASLDPASAEALLSLATVLHEREQWAEAQSGYEKALAVDPQLKPALWNLALLCESRADFRRAENLYGKLLEQYPDAQEVWFRLGYVRLQLSDFAACIPAFEKCLALPRKCPEALLNIGIAHWKMRRIEMAKETFRQALGSAAKSVEALRFLAAIALEQQDYEQAVKLHKQLLELEEPSSDLLC